MAGIIGAHDAAADLTKDIAKLDPSVQLGVAPDATLEAIKLGTTDGSTDVSQVIAALNWITEHQVLPNGSGCAWSTCPTAPSPCSPTRSTRSRPRPRTRGGTGWSSWCRPVTTATTAATSTTRQ